MRALIVIAISACATTPSAPAGGPRGLRASEHLDEAHAHDEVARHRFVGHEDDGAPWPRHWDTTRDNEQAAAVHRSEAADLRAAYEKACAGRTLAEASVSPLDRYAIGGYATATTVVLYLAPTVRSPDRLLAGLACHRAWMMLAPEDDTDDPLDLPGLVIDANGGLDGITVSIGAHDPEIVDVLHRRAAHLLERNRPRADLR